MGLALLVVALPLVVTRTDVVRAVRSASGAQVVRDNIGGVLATPANDSLQLPTVTPTPRPTATLTRTHTATQALPPGATVRIGSGSVNPGGSVTVPLDALNIPDPGLAAVTVDIQYDNAVVDATACAPDPNHDFDTALCNVDFAPNVVRLSAIKASCGLTGNEPLANLTFKALGQQGQVGPLNMTVVTFAECNGANIPVSHQDGSISIATLAPTAIPTLTPTATPTLTPTATPIALPLVSVPMMAGWNARCYVGEQKGIEVALGAIADKVLAVYILNSRQEFDSWFPGRPDLNTITTLEPHDQVFVLMSAGATWVQEESTAPQPSVSLVQGWNSVCYTGQQEAVADATSGIAGEFSILYMLTDSQSWARFVPNRPDLSDISQLKRYDSVLVLVTQAGGGQWACVP